MKQYSTHILKSDTSSGDMNEKVNRWLYLFENFHKKYIIMFSKSLNSSLIEESLFTAVWSPPGLINNMWMEYCFISFIFIWKCTYGASRHLWVHFLIVKVVKWPPAHINFVVFNLCKNKIIFFIIACQFFVTYYIHDDVIKYQTTLHDTSRTIITDTLMLQWKHNKATCQGIVFWWK